MNASCFLKIESEKPKETQIGISQGKNRESYSMKQIVTEVEASK